MEPLERRALLAAEVEPNNSFATGTSFSGNDTLTGVLTNVNDVDFFQVALLAGDSVEFLFSDNVQSGAATFGPTMELVNASGEVKAVSRDSHTFSYTIAVPGTYALRLTAPNAFGIFTESYSIAATITPFSGVTETEPNNTQAAATSFSGETEFRGTLSNAVDTDFFSFNVAAGDTIAVKFADKAGANPAVRLYSPIGTLVTSNLNGQGLVANILQPGNYSISIQSDNTAGSVTGSYVGQLLISSDATVDPETGNGFDSATKLDMGPFVIPSLYLSPDSTFASRGLTGSYVNRNLRGTASQASWIGTQTIAGTRLDPLIHFPQNDWGNRASLSLTNGPVDNWNNFSVQWDGYVRIVTPGTQIFFASDDSSRMWIDLNGDGSFNSSGTEFLDNNWGSGQGNTIGPGSVALSAGDYRIRIQYEEGTGDNNAFFLWNDAANSAGTVSRNNEQAAMGTLSSLSDVDVYAVQLSGTGYHSFTLDTTGGELVSKNRRMTLYNEFGQPLDYSNNGRMGTFGTNTRPELNGKYYVAVQAVNDSGLGPYELITRIDGEFPIYRDIPLFYQDYSGYNKPAHIPVFIAFFESFYDMYQIDVTQTNPGGGEHVDWLYETKAGGCGGSQGGGFGTRRPSGSGSGSCDTDWVALAELWFGLFYHENGHGVGVYHARHPLNTMSYGGQYDYLPIGSSNWMAPDTSGAGDPRISDSMLFNFRNYLDWIMEAGRIVLEDETNDNLTSAQRLEPFLSEMMGDADSRNDQVVVVGTVSTPNDTDMYRITAVANETYSIDIDSAEFQYPLDAQLEIVNGSGVVLATNQAAMDRDTGIASVDPFLTYQFTSAGNYYVRIRSEQNTFGNYRLKVTPQRAFDATGPRVSGSWPNGGSTVDGTRQLIFWINDQLDPATLTSNNIVVTGQANGTRSGTAFFDPLTSTLTWRADSVLPPDNYTLTLRSGAGGITDLRGNPLDGETDGILNFPDVSGNGVAGGNFVSTFIVNQADATPAVISSSNYVRQQHDRDLFDISFTDELDILDVYSKPFTLRGAGNDYAFNTADDTFSPVDVVYDHMANTSWPMLRVYTRGVLDPDSYRVEASLLDAAGHSVSLSQVFDLNVVVPVSALYTSTAKTTSGLIGSYVDQSLRSYAPQDDWRLTQTISGTRNDPQIGFYNDSFGTRASVGVTSGSDSNWNRFSVQWDGVIEIPANGVRLFTRSDDSSRMWIDVNNDGTFGTSGAEFINNNWGSSQGATTSPPSVSLNAGTYRIRVQYEEGQSGNQMQLLWDYGGVLSTVDGLIAVPKIVDAGIQPNSVLTTPPSSIDVTFSQAINTATLSTSSFQVRYSPDSTFFDGNDSYLTEADGAIAWDPAYRKATFQPASSLTNGYYLLELEGDGGGIQSANGLLLDGEFRDANIAGFNPQYGWNDAPSGDGVAGGDYRAMFIVSMPTVSLSVSPGSIAEQVGESVVTATLSAPTTLDVAVTLAFSGTATHVSDYSRSATVILIPAGATSGTITLTAAQDAIDEPNETILVDIVNVANGAEFGTQQVTATITDDDVAPSVTLGISSASLAEAAGAATITATLSAVSGQTVTVDLVFSGTATNNSDYTRTGTQIVIPAGSTTGTITLNALQDTLNEMNESIVVDVANVTNGIESTTQQVTATVVDDDLAPNVTLSLNPATIAESAGTTVITATLSALSGQVVTIDLSFAGPATLASDFTRSGTQIVIPAGAASGTITLTAVQDTLDEIDETVVVDIANVANGTESGVQQVTATIVDDDLPPNVTLSTAPATIAETAGTSIVTATLSAVSSRAVTIDLLFAGSATVTADYSRSGSQIVIPAGALTGGITLDATHDVLDELNETIVVDIDNVTNGTEATTQQVTVTVIDDDAAPSVTLSLDPIDIAEGGGSSTVTATLSAVSGQAVVVDLAFSGTALLTNDYLRSGTQIHIPAGSLSGTIDLTAVQDAIHENHETIIVDVAAVANGIESTPQQITANIINDDSAPNVTLSIDNSSIPETAGSATITATLSAISGLDVTVDLGISGTATLNTDYTRSGLQIVIPAGSLSGSISVTAEHDVLDEINETIIVDIDSVTQGTEAVEQQVIATVTDDDATPTVSLNLTQTSIPEAAGTATFTATLSAVSGQNVTVDFAFSGTATSPNDYTRSASQIVILAGATSGTITLTAVQDAVGEGNETIVVDISSVTNGTSTGASQLAVNVIDDDLLYVQRNVSSMSENGGTATGTVSRGNPDIGLPLVVTLASDKAGKASVPVTVTIPANQVSATFAIVAVDNTLLDGTQTVTITASATGYLNGAVTIDVTDSESLSLAIDATSIRENGETAGGTVTRSNTDTSQPLVVALTNNRPGKVTVPATVTIPANQSSATFNILAIDNALLDGTQTATITASAAGYASGMQTLDVVDVETLTVTINAASISENGGNTTGTVSRSNTNLGQPLVVTLANSVPGKASVPATVTIAANQVSATFSINAVDNTLLDGTQTVMITASASGYVSGSQSFDVIDRETLSLTMNATSISEVGGSVTGTITRSNSDISQSLEVSLSSNNTGRADMPASVTIPANQASATFTINAVDNALLDGTQALTITASAAGYANGVAAVDITDVESIFVDIAVGSIAENGGTLTGSISRSNTDTTQPLVVTLASNKPGKTGVPATATIPADQASATFTITITDNALLDGTQTVTITASAAGYTSGTDTLDVTDLETLTININATSISENGGVATGTVTRSNTDITQPLVIALTNDNPSKVTIPATITIPANQATAVFTISAINNTLLDGTQTATFTASAPGYGNGTKSLNITDLETLIVTFDTSSINENGGTAAATVTRGNTDIAQPLVVNLASDTPAKATVPATVTIPANQASTTFTVSAVDNALLDNTQTVTITVSAAGYLGDNRPLQILDNETLKPWHNSRSPRDVDDNNFVVPFDVLLIVNSLNLDGARSLPSNVPVPQNPPRYYDVNGDNFLSPIDALIVINFLNGDTNEEGEGDTATILQVVPNAPLVLAEPAQLHLASMNSGDRRNDVRNFNPGTNALSGVSTIATIASERRSQSSEGSSVFSKTTKRKYEDENALEVAIDLIAADRNRNSL